MVIMVLKIMTPCISIETLASEVRRRKMAIPAVFFLEMYKPLSSTLHNIGLVSLPFLAMIFGTSRAKSALELLSSRENIESLIQLIEENK